MPMRPLGDGRTWVLDVPLPPGRHTYAYLVDGDLTIDPAAPRAATMTSARRTRWCS